jgi:putative tryptophan/tyrosine transport system substrate-binding protein
VAATTPVSLAVMRATTTIPVVATSVADPVASGLADSLARPGRNITSLSLIATDLTGKRLEILKEVIPGLVRLGVLMNPDDPAAMLQVAEARSAAAALGLDVRMLDARPSNDLGVIFEGIAKDEVQALAIPQASWFVNNRSRIARLAIEHRVPTIVGARIEVTAGALLGYGTDLRSIFRRSAYLLDKILKGTNPADIPVEQPTRFELVINLKTARALGLEIPATLLARADEVIE